MSKKKQRDVHTELLDAKKARDFQRAAQSVPGWQRQESGKGDHKHEVYETANGGELRNPWDAEHGEVSIGVRHKFVRLLVKHGLLILVVVAAIIILLRGG